MFNYIVKRNGKKEKFNSEKITKAIFKSLSATGDADWSKAEKITDDVLKKLKKLNINQPTVEKIQDVVERALVNNNLAKVAKAYILYRKKRAEIRKEKAQILNKNKIDEVDKRFDLNSLRVLASRYLKKDENDKIIESPKELFIRVAIHGTIPSLLYDKRIYKKTVNKKTSYKPEWFDPIKNEGVVSIGKYKLNRYHLRAMKRVFDRMSLEGNIKVSWSKFWKMLERGEFGLYENEVTEYYNLMVERKFMPNTPVLANFGNVLGMGSACFVLGIDDDIVDIMDKLKAAALIFKAGGGVGYNFSHLRPEGDFVKSTGGIASGPISFMTMFDNMTEVIKQGGIRRGANMGIMDSNHPDILKFIKVKEGNKSLRNFNISVLLKSDFWKYYKEKKPYPLVNPRNKKVVAYVDPIQLFDMIIYQAWGSAEPGILFEDNINEHNPLLDILGPIESTNPCGEVLLYPYESCNLGSVNLSALVNNTHGKKSKLDWNELFRIVKIATKFLDNVVDINLYPLPEIERQTLLSRKIGLGIMGVGDLLYELSIPYNSKKGLNFMKKIMEAVNYYTKIVSINLARERGPMPLFNGSAYAKGKLAFSGFYNKNEWHFDWAEISKKVKSGIRNAYTTVIAPTGSISMIAGTSSGIEPVYSVVFKKNVSVGSFYYVDPVFEKTMKKNGLMDEDLIKDVVKNNGSIKNLSYISDELKKIFVTAHDISPKDHIYALAAFQKWTDSSISKTNNFPFNATVDDVKDVYMLAHKLGCKGATIFRDGSIQSQVLRRTFVKEEKKIAKKTKKKKELNIVQVEDEKASGLSVYKEASSSNSSNMDFSPVSVETSKDFNNGIDYLEEQITFNGAESSCKICNLE